MIEYQFTLNDRTASEPINWSSVVLGMLRDEEVHGVSFQATISNLGFYGADAEYLAEQKRLYGISAKVIFTARQKCAADEEPEEVLSGRLNFGRYRRTCGEECIVTMPVEQEGCAVTLLNRYDQRVDLDSLQAFDRYTPLANYPGMGFGMELQALNLEVGVVGRVPPGGNMFNESNLPGSGGSLYVRPVFSVKENESLKIGQLEPTNDYGTGGSFIKTALSPILLLDDNPDCFTGIFDVEIRLKGTYDIQMSGPSSTIAAIAVSIFETDDPTISSPNNIEFARQNLPAGGTHRTGSFDLSFSNAAQPLRQGFGFYGAIGFAFFSTGPTPTVVINWDEETHVRIIANKSCPPTEAQVYLVNEILSRITESITNNCMRVKSDYYGRVDSQPYASEQDGCGALRVLTSGLKLRRAENPGFFMSLQEAINGLKAIDNIGFGVEPDPNIPGYDWLRVEPVEYFYQDFEIMELPYVPTATIDVDEGKHYSTIKVGYTKWETQETFGLDEFNSNREYRTSLDTVRNPLDIQSNFIAGGYPIELTRQQSFVSSGEADSTYDNDTFIICVERQAYGYKVEQGVVTNAANVYSPETAYNWRITPLRNLGRWFKSIVNSYANIVDTAAKLFFSSGTGNYMAEGQLIDDCAWESGVVKENKDLWYTDFKNKEDYLPLTKPEFISVGSYPLSLAEYKKIRSNPYGYISVNCGNSDEWVKGYVIELNYQPAQGQASFKLRLKWE